MHKIKIFLLKIEEDVNKEIERIKSLSQNSINYKEPLVINQVLKLFKKNKVNIAAVDNLCFGVKSQSCFGLLVKKYLFKNF